MKLRAQLSSRFHDFWPRRRSPAPPRGPTPPPAQALNETRPTSPSGPTCPTPPAAQNLDDTSPAQPSSPPVVRNGSHHRRRGSVSRLSESPWSAAYNEALSLLDEEKRLVVSKGENLEKLFAKLSETNDKQKTESILRRGVVKLQTPIKSVNAIVKISSGIASVNPTASAAFSIVQSVTTLAVGVCGMEDRLNSQIADMLAQIKVIDECDALGQNFDDNDHVHEALVEVYKDLLLFYYAVVHVLTKKSVALAWIAEQFNERIPPVVQDFLKHASLLHQYIENATVKIIQTIESILTDATIKQLLGSNKVNPLELFHLDLKEKRANDACEWIADDPVFCAWHETMTAKPLALYGEMGCGKTIIMAFLIDHVTQLQQGRIPSALIFYHYCRDDERGKPVYIYSSLIQQLVQKKKQFKVAFISWYERNKSERGYSPANDSKLLEEFFFTSIGNLERPVFLFLDGLDECDDKSCQELVTTLKHQLLKIPGLKCCVSVRYTQHIQALLHGSSEIHIHKDSERDALIVSHMINKNLPFLEGEARDLAIGRLSGLTKGSAIWARKAVDLLASRKFHAIERLRDFLDDELPQSNLSDLYCKLFTQVTEGDKDSAQFLSHALEILATADRPLSITEISWAVALRDSKKKVETIHKLKGYVDTIRLCRFLSPFVSSLQFKEEHIRQVQLNHQSVRELVFRSSPYLWMENGAPAETLDYSSIERQSQMHGKMAQECVKYLLLAEIGAQDLFSTEEVWAQSLDMLPGADLFDDSSEIAASAVPSLISIPPIDGNWPYFDPAERGFGGLFTYASCYWLHHLSRAEHSSGPSLSDVITLTTPGLTRSENWWEQFCRPDCTRQRDESKALVNSVDPLTMVSLYGPAYLFDELVGKIQSSAEGGVSFTVQQRENAVQTILRHGDISRLSRLICFDENADVKEAIHFSVAVMLYWSGKCENLSKEEKNTFDHIFDHIASGFDIIAQQEWGNELLCLAAAHGCIPVLERLFRAASYNETLKQELLRTPHRDNGKALEAVHHQSVGDAAWNGYGAAVAFLLDQEGIEPHIRYRDRKGNNVIHKAVRGSDPATLKLLLSRYPEGMAERDEGGNTPLQVLVFRRRPNGPELIQAYLESGADVRCAYDGLTSDWDQPLRQATRYGDIGVIEVLVRVGGADPMSVFKPVRDENGELVLIDGVEDKTRMGRVKEALLSLARESQSPVRRA